MGELPVNYRLRHPFHEQMLHIGKAADNSAERFWGEDTPSGRNQ